MNIAITFRQMDATEAMKEYATEKIAKLQKFLRVPLKGKATLSCTHHRFHYAEIDVHAGAEHFHAHETSEDMYASIDKAVDKLETQIRETKAAISGRRKGAESVSHFLNTPPPEEE